VPAGGDAGSQEALLRAALARVRAERDVLDEALATLEVGAGAQEARLAAVRRALAEESNALAHASARRAELEAVVDAIAAECCTARARLAALAAPGARSEAGWVALSD